MINKRKVCFLLSHFLHSQFCVTTLNFSFNLVRNDSSEGDTDTGESGDESSKVNQSIYTELLVLLESKNALHSAKNQVIFFNCHVSTNGVVSPSLYT